MSEQNIVENLLLSLASQINSLSSSDMEKLGSGKYELQIKVTRKRSTKETTTNPGITEENAKELVNLLDSAKSREEGLKIIEEKIHGKIQLTAFARKIHVAVAKSDRVETIKNNIVDATVGARLRSGAIQGKEI